MQRQISHRVFIINTHMNTHDSNNTSSPPSTVTPPGRFLRVLLGPAPLRACQVSSYFFCCLDSPALKRAAQSMVVVSSPSPHTAPEDASRDKAVKDIEHLLVGSDGIYRKCLVQDFPINAFTQHFTTQHGVFTTQHGLCWFPRVSLVPRAIPSTFPLCDSFMTSCPSLT